MNLINFNENAKYLFLDLHERLTSMIRSLRAPEKALG